MRVLFVDFSTRLASLADRDRPRGGMITSLFRVPGALSQSGFDVEVLSDIGSPGSTPDGVRWVKEASGHYDVLVLNRGIGRLYRMISATHRVLWTHDLPHSGFAEYPEEMGMLSATVFMSGYAERIWRAFYRDIGTGWQIPNGVDKSIFHPREKTPHRMIYASAPNRGLKRLPLIYETIKAKFPAAELVVYSNLQVLHPNEAGSNEGLNECRMSGIEVHDPVPQREFAEDLGRCGLMLMPSDYPEICSNAILQALASGVPVVTTDGLGSAEEWIAPGISGALIGWYPHDYMIYPLQFAREVVKILAAPNYHQEMMINTATVRDIKTWEEVGAEWATKLSSL